MIANLNEIYAYACFIRRCIYIINMPVYTINAHSASFSEIANRKHRSISCTGKNQTSVNTIKLMVFKNFISLDPKGPFTLGDSNTDF